MALTTNNKMYLLNVLNTCGISNLILNYFTPSKKDKFTLDEVCDFMIKRVNYMLDNKIDYNVLSMAKHVKVIDMIIDYKCKDILKIDEELENELKKLRRKYNAYIKENNMVLDNTVIEFFDNIATHFQELDEVNDCSDKVEELLGKIDYLNNIIDGKNEKINLLNDDNDELKRKYDSIVNDLEEKKTTIKELKKKVEEKDKDYYSLSKKLDDDSKTIIDLSLKVGDLTEDNIKLNNILSEKQGEIDLIHQSSEDERKYNKHKNQLLEFLFEGNSSVDRLCLKLGNKYTPNEVYKMLGELNRIVKIKGFSSSDNPRLFGIDKIPAEGNGFLRLSPKEDSVDLLLMSDLHYSHNCKLEIAKNLDLLYDFATSKGIKNIINVGDLYHNGNYQFKGLNYDSYKEMCDNIESLSTIIPDVGINQYVLGGNHDASGLIYGIDPINELVLRRLDVLSLGYKNADIIINNDKIRLHHPNVQLKIKEDNPVEVVRNYLDNYYSSKISGRDSIYFDILGHVHQSFIDLSGAYAIIPSLTFDRIMNGFNHLKIYLNSDGKIDFIILNPYIITDNKVYPTGAIVYQKKLVK